MRLASHPGERGIYMYSGPLAKIGSEHEDGARKSRNGAHLPFRELRTGPHVLEVVRWNYDLLVKSKVRV